MTLRRLLPLLALIALVVAPFGRMAAAEAMTMPHGMAHGTMSAPGHCGEMPHGMPHGMEHGTMSAAGFCGEMPPADDSHPDRAIDCMIACAAVLAADSLAAEAPLPTADLPVDLVLLDFHGITPESEPPPPRFS